ncbi:phosphatase PAP2 family protein [Parapedobacter sp. ISTM3]|uniref:PAP2 superfamily protein n=1 Tax=Parapedobacter luteus TaxID=623280 RepID=A0A1T5A1N3_9SPHI|nr:MULTISPECIES: phosphatase PAP2 family protein [Parapedobacter]MBK1440064.1 phosphatase PAP2 family protein [Parapedobacter sp. ISTM3]SKB28931.1 PAP2 superfamily protein [Parapedobacter luteus]
MRRLSVIRRLSIRGPVAIRIWLGLAAIVVVSSTPADASPVAGRHAHRTDSVHRDTATFLAGVAQDFLRFGDGFLYTLASPVKWRGNDWLKVGGVIAGTALTTLADKPVRNFWLDQDSKLLDGIERAGFHYGKPYAAFYLMGGFYLTGLAIKSEWARETAMVLGAAYLTSGAVQSFMKTAFGRARPATEVGPWAFKPWSPEAAYHSFPSGHIQIAMVSAVVLAERVEQPWLKGVFYSTAGVTLISRMYSDSHWLSDLAFGGAISYFSAKAVLKRMEQTKSGDHMFRRKKKEITWNFTPTFNGFALVGTL